MEGGRLTKSPLPQSRLASLNWGVFSSAFSNVSSVVEEVKLLSMGLAKLITKD